MLPGCEGTGFGGGCLKGGWPLAGRGGTTWGWAALAWGLGSLSLAALLASLGGSSPGEHHRIQLHLQPSVEVLGDLVLVVDPVDVLSDGLLRAHVHLVLALEVLHHIALPFPKRGGLAAGGA